MTRICEYCNRYAGDNEKIEHRNHCPKYPVIQVDFLGQLNGNKWG